MLSNRLRLMTLLLPEVATHSVNVQVKVLRIMMALLNFQQKSELYRQALPKVWQDTQVGAIEFMAEMESYTETHQNGTTEIRYQNFRRDWSLHRGYEGLALPIFYWSSFGVALHNHEIWWRDYKERYSQCYPKIIPIGTWNHGARVIIIISGWWCGEELIP